ALLHGMGSPIKALIELKVSKEELIKRVISRGQTSGRADDTEEVARKRVQVYESETRPVAEYYASQGKHFEMDGLGAINDVFQRISAICDMQLMAAKELD
ncbi:MAG: nucleoside monophosphate kinase, partial [Bacteroidota bacterium]|nr:nucleoside monophosphate kinase [Bacteroidota bacterium]